MPVTVFNSKNIFRRVREATNRGIEKAAKQLPREIVYELKAGRRPSDGSSQPPLAQSTIRDKARRGAPLIPGVDTGLLTTAGRWEVVSTGRGWEVYPPAARATAVYHLESRSDPYEIVAVPPRWTDDVLPREIKSALKGAR